MPKQGRRRRPRGTYIKGNVDEQLALSTLGAKTLISAVFDEVLAETARISSLVASWSMQEFTVASGDGPITVGIAHSDYTDIEIEQFIENAGSWNLGSKVQNEISKRLIRKVGTFRASGPGGSSFDPTVLNLGNPITTKLNWRMITGDSLKLWAYNMGSSALATTDPQVFVQGHVNIWQGS